MAQSVPADREKTKSPQPLSPAPRIHIEERKETSKRDVSILKKISGSAKWLNLLLIERLSYLMVLTPFLTDYAKTGKLPSSPSTLIGDALVGCVILAFVLLMRHTRRQVAQANGLRTTLNEAIIHDLKNPLTSITTCISCMIHDSPDAERQGVLLNLALHACQEQATLIDMLIDTSRLEHGELSIQMQSLNTREMLDTCLSTVSEPASHLGVDLKRTSSNFLPTELQGDPNLLPRVFLNLLFNALKYTPRGGSVSIDAGFKDGSFQFEIKDTGIGISPAHIERLFKKYYRVEGPDQNARRGSGLGLYFCRLVVEAHGGKIDVRSDVGRGTRITFNIPQVQRSVI